MRTMNSPDTIRSTLLDLHKTVLDTVRWLHARGLLTDRQAGHAPASAPAAVPA